MTGHCNGHHHHPYITRAEWLEIGGLALNKTHWTLKVKLTYCLDVALMKVCIDEEFIFTVMYNFGHPPPNNILR